MTQVQEVSIEDIRDHPALAALNNRINFNHLHWGRLFS
jgi:hypothetical protein